MINRALNQLNNQMKAQGMTFDPAIDCRNDLINYYGYAIDQVVAMSDDEVFSIMDELEATEAEANYNMLPLKCSKCNHHEMAETDYWDDCYYFECPKCKYEIKMHYTVYDGFLDSIEEAQQLKEAIK